MWNTVFIGLACLLLIGTILYEMLKDQTKTIESFDDSSNYFNTYFPKRLDVLPGQTVEDGGWVRDLRYKEQYVDIQKTGMKSDLCRVVVDRRPRKYDNGVCSCRHRRGSITKL